MSEVEFRTYTKRECVVFRTTTGEFGGFSNMAPGYEIRVLGRAIRTSEALYQACRFPDMPDVQLMIINELSPMTAKMRSKPFRKNGREDWDKVRVPIMKWCLRLKLMQNWQSFGRLLKASRGRSIVEESKKDDYWGAKPMDDGTLNGRNVLGRLLMGLREEYLSSEVQMSSINPVPIDRFKLMGEDIPEIVAGERSNYIHARADQGSLALPPGVKPYS